MLKFVVAFAVLSCVFQNAFSFPAQETTTTTTTSKPSAEAPLIPDVETILTHVVGATIVGFFMGFELTAIAAGTHIMELPSNYSFDQKFYDIDKRHHVVARSALELWIDLPSAHKVAEMFDGVFQATLENGFGSDPIIFFIKTFDRNLTNDAAVNAKYKTIRDRVEKELTLSADHYKALTTKSNLHIDFLNSKDPIVKMAAIHARVMQYSSVPSDKNKTDATADEYAATIKSIVELSKKSQYAEKVQKIYDDVILQQAEIVQKTLVADTNLSQSDSSVAQFRAETDRTVFKNLSDKLSNDPALKTEFEQLRQAARSAKQ